MCFSCDSLHHCTHWHCGVSECLSSVAVVVAPNCLYTNGGLTPDGVFWPCRRKGLDHRCEQHAASNIRLQCWTEGECSAADHLQLDWWSGTTAHVFLLLGHLSSSWSSTYCLILRGNNCCFELVPCSTEWQLAVLATNYPPHQRQTLWYYPFIFYHRSICIWYLFMYFLNS